MTHDYGMTDLSPDFDARTFWLSAAVFHGIWIAGVVWWVV